AIAETAEAVFTDRFNAEQQAIARRIFLRLTELGDETALGDTRRRVAFAELVPRPEESEATQIVLNALADARLITASADFVEVAHEALIREWPRLRSWLDENREGLRLHRQLTQAAQDWLNHQCEPDMLYRGVRLVQAQEWANVNVEDLNDQEREFLSASLALSKNEAAEREAHYQRELEAAQKLANTEREKAEEGILYTQRLRRRSVVISVIGTLAIVMAVIAIFAWISSASQTARLRSVSLASAARIADQRGQGDLAIALAMEAVKINPPPIEALNALRSVATSPGTRKILRGHSQEVRTAALSPDGKVAFSGSCAQLEDKGGCKLGELILWDVVSGKEQMGWNAHSSWVTAVAFSSDGQTLISGGEDGSLFLWDRGGNYIDQLFGHWDSISDLAALTNSDNLLSGSVDGYLILWDLKTGNVLQRFAVTESPIIAISVASNVSLALSVNQTGSIKLWDFESRQPIRDLPRFGYDIKSIALGPTGQWILVTSSDTPGYNLRMISTRDGSILHQQSFSCIPGDLAVSSDLSYALITCSSTIIQMDLLNWSIQKTFSVYNEIFNTISISQDGKTALSSTRDGRMRVWDLGEELPYRIQTIDTDFLTAIDITSDGKYLLFNDAEKDGISRPALWDITQNKVITTCNSTFTSFSPGGVKVSPDGRFAAAVGLTYSNYKMIAITLWDLKTGQPYTGYPLFLANGGAIAFSHNSRYILIGSQEADKQRGQLFIVDIETKQTVVQFETIQDISSIAFSSDDSRAISGSSYLANVILWDVRTGKEIRRFSYAAIGPVSAVAIGPGDETILGAGLGELYLWDIDTGELLRTYSGLTAAPRSVAISPNGKYILSGTERGELILWDFTTGEELHRENFNMQIYSVLFSPDEKTAYAAAIEGKLIELQIEEKSHSELLEWIKTNRYVPELTCAEKLQYHVPDRSCNP
ncbi:MAG TPA: hypothetical protein VLD65_07065, partial [Anaerolineales bacterium]|nr:hypothetical protein [Anaerolineales bacterium]